MTKPTEVLLQIPNEPTPFSASRPTQQFRQVVLHEFLPNPSPEETSSWMTTLNNVYVRGTFIAPPDKDMWAWFEETLTFASQRGLLWDAPNASLRRCLGNYLQYLDRFPMTKVVLEGRDGPYGFAVNTYRWTEGAWRFSWNGGLLYYGAGDSGVGGPNLSVRLGEDLSEGWSLHT